MFSLFAKSLGQPSPIEDFWYTPVAPRTASGISVTETKALTYSAVWAATSLLVGTTASLPFNLKRRTGRRTTDTASSHQVHHLIHTQPNPDMGSSSWRSYGVARQVNGGNFFNEIQRDDTGRPIALWPIDNSRVTPGRLGNEFAAEIKSAGIPAKRGALAFQVENEDGSKEIILDENMFRPRAVMSRDGILGIGVIEAARESIGFGIAIEEQGAAFFRNSQRPSIVIKNGKFRDREQKEEFRRQWSEVHGGARNNAKPALLPMGADIEQFGFSNEDSQFLESREFSVNEIARWYRIPPHMIGDLRRSTFSNIEVQGIEFVVYSLVCWLRFWEEEVNRKLLTPAERKEYFAKHNVDALLRGDTAARAIFYRAMWEMGAFSTNDVLELEDRNPVEGGDKRFRPMNFQSLTESESPKSGDQNPPPAQQDDQSDDEDDRMAATLQAIEVLASRQDDAALMIAELHRRDQLEHRQVAELPPNTSTDAAAVACKQMIQNTIGRLLSRDAQAVKAAVNKPAKEFYKWVDETYGDQQITHFAKILKEPIAVWCSIVGKIGEEDSITLAIAEDMSLGSRQMLMSAMECEPEQLESRVGEALENWQHRPSLATLLR